MTQFTPRFDKNKELDKKKKREKKDNVIGRQPYQIQCPSKCLYAQF